MFQQSNYNFNNLIEAPLFAVMAIVLLLFCFLFCCCGDGVEGLADADAIVN